MSRITAPASKLARTLAESHRSAGAVIMPKYDELLRAPRRPSEHQQHSETRGLTTTHRPTPQPSIAHRTRPLMQGFHSSTPSKTPAGYVDTTVLPKIHPIPTSDEPIPRVPLLPDNYGAFHHSLSDAADLARGNRPIIFAVDPDLVVPGAPMADMEVVNLDNVELKFAHEPQPAATTEDGDKSTFFSDIIRSMRDDVFAQPQTQKA
ncbi:hypothetical protein LCI18_012328 [Fusarium solani-melongenae]|uniref:Uncharacterized protein n=1 Tax=Fusarium solani subsp. cucurbitae TaxID=2747967 RepID=A0ACD3ZJA2_FUSSC|nr:hypothetical protein LCI18_012328 [Fusarium solani-melongenae]